MFKLTILGKEYNVNELSIGKAYEIRKMYFKIYEDQVKAENNIKLIAKTNKDFASVALKILRINAKNIKEKAKYLMLTKNKLYYNMTESEYTLMIMQVAKIIGIGTKEEIDKKKVQ